MLSIMKKIKFYTTENAWSYVNFIDDNDLGDKLDNFECGYQSGNFFIDIEGKEDLINHIKRKSMKDERGKYARTNETKLKQSKKMKVNK